VVDGIYTTAQALGIAIQAVADFEGDTEETEDVLLKLDRLAQWVEAQGEDLEWRLSGGEAP
jgi:hypothetical protein